MVIMHVVAPGEVGGLERVVQMLGRGLHGLGHDVHVLALALGQETAEPFLAPLAEAGVSTRTLALSGRAYLRERAAIAQVLRQLSPDVVHTHGYRTDVLDAVWPGASGSPSSRPCTGSPEAGGRTAATSGCNAGRFAASMPWSP